MSNLNLITVSISVNATIEKVWEYFTNPAHITKWYFASKDWCCPNAENNLHVGGKFITRMESKDGAIGFDFEGIYSTIVLHKNIEYYLADGRTVSTLFKDENNEISVSQIFVPENENSLEMQQGGWQAILNNFKKYLENN